jgi:dsDNA-binding SOS-regulon protein
VDIHVSDVIIGAAITIGISLITFAVMWGYNKRRLDEMDDKHEASSKKHADHYREIGDINTALASISTEAKAHFADDNRQFGEVGGMLKEQREDIKQLIRMVGELGGKAD